MNKLGQLISTIEVASLFLDHTSRTGYAYFQKSTSAEDTLLGKSRFERFAYSHRVHVRKYRTDNLLARHSTEFVNNIQQKLQTITYCAVNGHYQKCGVERYIRTVMEISRTILY